MHCHSNYSSDGAVSSEDIIRQAKKLQLGALSIADHDTIGAIPDALVQARSAGVNLIPAVEMTTNLRDMFLHLLGYHMDVNDPILLERLQQLDDARWEQAWARVKNLRRLGFSFEDDELTRRAQGKAPVGPIIAMALFDHPDNADDPRIEPYRTGNRSERPYYFFDKDWMHEGGPAFAPANRPDIFTAIRFMRSRAIVPVLAHPGEKFDYANCNADISSFKDAGLLGMEVYTSYHDQAQTEGFARLAERFDLFATCGSDFHGEQIKPGITLGMLDVEGEPILRHLEEARELCHTTSSQFA